MYLTENIIGTASGKVYGKIGDKVYILKIYNDMYLVANEKGDKFYCKFHQVSSTYSKK